jgi:hypothetical protein
MEVGWARTWREFAKSLVRCTLATPVSSVTHKNREKEKDISWLTGNTKRRCTKAQDKEVKASKLSEVYKAEVA